MLTGEDLCKPCLAGYLCPESRLTRMQEAQVCQEGFICWFRSTNTVMLNNKVLEGYYGS